MGTDASPARSEAAAGDTAEGAERGPVTVAMCGGGVEDAYSADAGAGGWGGGGGGGGWSGVAACEARGGAGVGEGAGEDDAAAVEEDVAGALEGD